MRFVLIIVSTTILSACFPLLPGDGAFRVVGEVTTQSGVPAKCLLRLFAPSEPSKILEAIEVGGVFKETFMAPPTRDIYEVQLFCSGSVVRTITVKYGTEVHYENPIDIGHVVL